MCDYPFILIKSFNPDSEISIISGSERV